MLKPSPTALDRAVAGVSGRDHRSVKRVRLNQPVRHDTYLAVCEAAIALGVANIYGIALDDRDAAEDLAR